MRLVTVAVVLLVCSPLTVDAGGDAATEEMAAAERYRQADEDLKAAEAELELVQSKIRHETVDRQEEPKEKEPSQGNLRGTNGLARSSTVTKPDVVDHDEAKLAETQAKEALAENNYEEAVGEMAKFFEFHEQRAAGMRERSNEIDATISSP
jgi:chromatin segregation and condensation protein Rec8/ScpA/Scc1 (kleisin family)